MNRVIRSRRAQRELPTWVSAAAVLGTFAALYLWESRRPLRRRQVEPKVRRNLRNLAVAGSAAVGVQLAERPMAMPLTRLVERRQLGLLKQFPMPSWLEAAIGIVLMDYTLYLWHVLTHKVPLLWRFHKAHHADLDMDASTAIRFHIGEMMLSAPWRAAQVLLIGVSPRTFSIWQTLLICEVMFHHSNVRLPPTVERWLGKVIVTPRMHGIHHSVVIDETDSNWSSGLTVWDWLHGTLRNNVPNEQIIIGVPAYRKTAEVTLPKVLAMPFDGQNRHDARQLVDQPVRVSQLSDAPAH